MSPYAWLIVANLLYISEQVLAVAIDQRSLHKLQKPENPRTPHPASLHTEETEKNPQQTEQQTAEQLPGQQSEQQSEQQTGQQTEHTHSLIQRSSSLTQRSDDSSSSSGSDTLSKSDTEMMWDKVRALSSWDWGRNEYVCNEDVRNNFGFEMVFGFV